MAWNRRRGSKSMTGNGVVEAEGKSIYGSKRKTTTRGWCKGGIVSKVTSCVTQNGNAFLWSLSLTSLASSVKASTNSLYHSWIQNGFLVLTSCTVYNGLCALVL